MTVSCFHVAATNGLLYGVAATTQTEARSLLQQRLTAEAEESGEELAQPTTAKRIGGRWHGVAFGTTLCYGEAS